jgi:predicted nucleic acid-binding protein
LLDTNILVYAINPNAPFHIPCKILVERALDGKYPAYLAHQNLMELYAVVTDKRRVEHPLSPEEANGLLEFYLSTDNLTIIYPNPTTFTLLRDLISLHSPLSHGIFDLMLVALMKQYDIPVIHTLNTRHFKNYQGITAISPIT